MIGGIRGLLIKITGTLARACMVRHAPFRTRLEQKCTYLNHFLSFFFHFHSSFSLFTYFLTKSSLLSPISIIFSDGVPEAVGQPVRQCHRAGTLNTPFLLLFFRLSSSFLSLFPFLTLKIPTKSPQKPRSKIIRKTSTFFRIWCVIMIWDQFVWLLICAIQFVVL